MSAAPGWDLACVGYLAHARLLHVARYPAADTGAVVLRGGAGLAGDAPITAVAGAGMGLRTSLVANRVAADPAGQQVVHAPGGGGAPHRAGDGPAPARTPHLTVVTDAAGTRTWFADLADAPGLLCQTDLAQLADARLVYLDGYAVIAPAAARVLGAAGEVPVLLNLGGDGPPGDVLSAARDARLFAVQASLPEDQADRAQALAEYLLGEMKPAAAVVTLGRLGALAATRAGWLRIPAPAFGPVHTTHGAGAAFSAGLAAAHLAGEDLPAALDRAVATGTAHCTTRPDEPQPQRSTAI